MEFKPFPKIPRLSREVVVTEKLDGTNASVYIANNGDPIDLKFAVADVLVGGVQTWLFAGSRNRWLDCTSKGDNYGFAKWVRDNTEELAKLGPGHHFGEWWGQGIQRNYGLQEKRFSLFNVAKWTENRPACCHVVPVLYRGPFDTANIDSVVGLLAEHGSQAAPGFMNPEGVIVYHTAGNHLYKKTVKDDEKPKNA